jgi:uncharacterized surface protein with fasciclin (FAS1) repeats
MNHIARLFSLTTLASILVAVALIPRPAIAVEETAPKAESLRIPQALAAAGFTKFAAAIEAAGLTETLEEDGPFTCFAPSDEAFDAMPDETRKMLKETPAGEHAQAWIKYHFVKGVAIKRDDLMKIPGANGFADKYLRVWVPPGKITINRICEITRFDIVAANGVIHGVARVLDAEDEMKVYQKKAP